VNGIEGVVITGTIGVGKTAVAEALSELMHRKDMRHALIDVDWLGQVYPPPRAKDPYDLALAFTNLTAIAPNFHAAGARYFIVAATLTSRSELDRLRSALPRVRLHVCRVTASPETIAARIRGRELGSLLDDFLTRTQSLDRHIAAARLEDFTVVNDNRPIAEIASELLEGLAWGPASKTVPPAP
jgi:adenylylsulfate kinase